MIRRNLHVAFAAMLLAAGPSPADASERPLVEYVRRPGATGPFSSAVRVGDTLYLSGMIGGRPDGTLPEGIEAQTRQTLENIRTVLVLTGHDLDDVVRCTVMLDNMADWAAFNRIYVEYFRRERLPARSAFGADGLALGALVEVECQAFAPDARIGRP
jgi:2-iminobutanoate/2-iminopropanoate deaminase